MIAEGYTGRKGKGGFYRLNRERRQAQGGDRSRDRRVPRREQKPQLDGDRGKRADLQGAARTRQRARPLRLARAGADARLCRRAGAGERPTTSPPIDEAMRLGYNWKWPVRADRPARRRLVRRTTGSGRHAPCRRCCASRRASAFYRVEDGKRQYLGLDGDYHDVVAPRGRAAARGHQARRQAGAEERLRRAVGHRRRRRLLRVHQQDERARSRHHGAARARRSSWSTKQFKALVIYNEGDQFLGRRQSRPRAVRRQYRRLERDREARRAGPDDLQGAEIRALPGGRRAGRHGARRRLRDPAALRRRAGACRNLYRPGRSRRRADSRLGRLQGNAGALAAPRPDCRKARCRRSQRSSRRSARRKVSKSAAEAQGAAVPAPDRRHHHEPRPPAGRRQGQGAGAGRRTTSRRSRRVLPARARAARRRWTWRSTASRSSARRRRTTWWSPARSPRC